MRPEVTAIRIVRSMRGGSQARLVKANDGHYYVVKFLNNPQHRRVLLNEWIGCALMRRLGLFAPETAAIQISAELLARSPVRFHLGQKELSAEPGVALGSRYPGDPDRLAVYDFFPSSLLRRVSNYGQFIGALVFDKWVGDTDKRQAVFHSQSVDRHDGGAMIATFIDNGFVLGGADWDLNSVGPLAGLYHDKVVYADITCLDSFGPWIVGIENLREQEVWRIITELPEEWLADDGDRLRALIERLLRRRKRLFALIEDVRRAAPALFPNWKENGFSAADASHLSTLSDRVRDRCSAPMDDKRSLAAKIAGRESGVTVLKTTRRRPRKRNQCHQRELPIAR